jgi:hypothetical protein
MEMEELAAAIVIALRAKQKRLNDLHGLSQRLPDPNEILRTTFLGR